MSHVVSGAFMTYSMPAELVTLCLFKLFLAWGINTLLWGQNAMM